MRTGKSEAFLVDHGKTVEEEKSGILFDYFERGADTMFVKFKRYKFLVIVLSLLLILISSSFAYEQKSTGYLEVIG